MLTRFMTIMALHMAALFFMGLAYTTVENSTSVATVSLQNQQVIAALPNS